MRIHAVACGYVLFFASQMELLRGEWACLLLAMGIVTAAEAMNTSVEKLCDRVEPRQDRQIGAVKDMAAGAVALSAAFAGLIGGMILLRPELGQVLKVLVTTPWKVGIFLLTVLAAGCIVFVVPQKRE